MRTGSVSVNHPPRMACWRGFASGAACRSAGHEATLAARPSTRGVLSAKQRPMLGGQAFGWDRKAGGSSVLVAVSLALGGCGLRQARTAPTPQRRAIVMQKELRLDAKAPRGFLRWQIFSISRRIAWSNAIRGWRESGRRL
jgi:hypothetical protein